MIPVAGLLAGVIPSSSIVVRTFATPAEPDTYGRTPEGVSTDTAEFWPVHSATTRQRLDRLPEADRQRETIAIYAGAESALVPDAGTTPAQVVYNGATYTVVAVGDYEDQGAVYLVLAQLQ